MKKALFIILSVLLVAGLFVACSSSPEHKANKTTYTVSFDMQGQGTQIDPIADVESGAKITKPTDPKADGFVFEGWYKEEACTNAWDFTADTVTADITLYAKWAEKTFKAVYDTTGGNNVLKFYYDADDHSGDNITVYDKLPTAATGSTDWPYSSVRTQVKSVVIDSSVADYKGLTSTASMFSSMVQANSISGTEYLDTANVTTMSGMFNSFGSYATIKAAPDVSTWNTSSVTNISGMFRDYGSLVVGLKFNLDLSNWDVSKVTACADVFSGTATQDSNKSIKIPEKTGEKVNTGMVWYVGDGTNSIDISSIDIVSLTRKTDNLLATTESLSGDGWNGGKAGQSCYADDGDLLIAYNKDSFKISKDDTLVKKDTYYEYDDGGINIKLYFDGTSITSIVVTSSKSEYTNFIGTYKADLIKGVFSVASEKQVQFTRGNLQATIDASGTPTAWKLADNQYDFIGEGGANKTIGTAAGDIDLFGWSTNATNNNYGIHTKAESTSGYTDGDFKDWGGLFEGRGYRTLTMDEWLYLINTRTATTVNGKENARYVRIKVDGIQGYLLFPDNNFTWVEATMGTAPSAEIINSFCLWSNASTFTSTQFKAMEDAGCVFLPWTGRRKETSVASDYGLYWSSTLKDADYAYCYDLSVLSQGAQYSRYYGMSVRLVKDVEEK